MTNCLKLLLAAAGLATCLAAPAFADEAPQSDNRLVIVSGNSGRVLYDDGYDDLFCVTRVHHWYDEDGYRHRHRTMRCR
jgi:hypothetical protein